MNLEDIKKSIEDNDIFILYVKSKICSVCVELLPKVAEVSKNNNVKFVDIYIEDNREVGTVYNVFSAPTIIMFVMGKEVYRDGRFLRTSELEATISKYKNLLL